jgi:hypothetical protein
MAAAVAAADAAVAAAGWEPGLPLPMLEEVEQLLDLLECDGSSELLTVEQLQRGLASLGYALEPSEVLELAKGLGYGVEGLEGVPVSQFAASQLDWEDLQVDGVERVVGIGLAGVSGFCVGSGWAAGCVQLGRQYSYCSVYIACECMYGV